MIPPVLDVRTTRVDDPGSLVDLLDPHTPLGFLRRGDGIVGIGEAMRLEFTGARRFEDAAAAWQSIVATATIDDAVGMPGTGLVAFGSFAFADGSSAASVLVVPRVIVGRRDGIAWVTSVNDAALPPLPPAGEPVLVTFTDTSADAFVAAVRAALAGELATRAGKVVLARSISGELPHDADLRGPIRALATRYPDTSTFAVDGLIGASPETLVRVSRGVVSARVLAGTSAPVAEAEATILASTKDRAEHAFAISSVLDSVAPHASVVASEPFALRLPNLVHLASDVHGDLADDSTVLDLVAALHPTAAVAGTPTDAALALIAQFETADRGRYAGPVGWVDANGDGEWAIALRCAHVSDGIVTAWAGAGIVAGSEPERELAETELKFAPIREAFR